MPAVLLCPEDHLNKECGHQFCYSFMQRKLTCSAGAQRNLKFTIVLITLVVPSKGFDWAYSFSGDGFHKFLISLSSLVPQANFLKAKP